MDSLRTLTEVLADADERLAAGKSAASRVWPTGFPLLDTHLGGGLRSGDLTLLGGPQGLGKTSFALQVLRSTVSHGAAGVYFSYEHDAATVLQRILAIEATHIAGPEAPSLRDVRAAAEAVDGRSGTLTQRLAAVGGSEAVRNVAAYGDRLLIHRSSGSTTDLDAIQKIALDVADRTGLTPLAVVDYLQKVAVKDRVDTETEMDRVTRIAEGLKDLALDLDMPVLAVVAADKEGLAAGRRLRVHNLRGSSALAYEPDVVLIMNDKYDVVARHHMMYDVSNAARFHDWAVLTIEKNRSGRDRVDMEFKKRFDRGMFDPAGRAVSEELVDERIFVE